MVGSGGNKSNKSSSTSSNSNCSSRNKNLEPRIVTKLLPDFERLNLLILKD